jgi:hypothetical protein
VAAKTEKNPLTVTRAHRVLIAVVVTGVIVIAGIGFAGSYAAVRELAIDKGFGTFSYLLPIGIDAGICVLLALDVLLTWTRIPFPLLRQAAWLLTAATIAFNGAAAWPDPLGTCMHAVIPVLFVVAIEAARHAIGRIADITADTGCGVERLTPGLAPDGGKLCTDCAGGLGDFTCEQCGQEARRYRRGVCGRCVLAEHLHELLDDGTGSVRRELLPLFDTLRQMKRPWGGLTWTNQPHVQRNLQALARHQVPLTHEGLSQLTPWRAVAYLRDLLMQCGVLPPADRHLLLFQRWLAEKLLTVSAPEHRRCSGALRRLAHPTPPPHPGQPWPAHRQPDPEGPERALPCDRLPRPPRPAWTCSRRLHPGRCRRLVRRRLHRPAPYSRLPPLGHAVQAHARRHRPAPLDKQSGVDHSAPTARAAATAREPR